MALREGDLVFLSASVPTREGWRENAYPAEIEEAIVSVARAVFARRGRLLFGGHPSVSPLISSVAGEYVPPAPGRPDSARPVITFQSDYFKGCQPDETWTMHEMGWASIAWTPTTRPDAIGQGCLEKAPPGAAAERQASLTRMRSWMLLGHGTPDAVKTRHGLKPPRMMIAIGGMEGVRDEATIFLRQRLQWGVQPLPRVYVVRSGGGAAARLVDAAGGWQVRLWRGYAGDTPDAHTVLEGARSSGELSALEDYWRDSRPGAMRLAGEREPEFQPYAAMTQWLMDTA